MFLIVLLSVTVLQRFAVPGAGSELGFGFVLCLLAIGFGVLTSRFSISLARSTLYALAACIMLATLFTKREPFSYLSLLMLLTLYAPYVATVDLSKEEWLALLNTYQRLMLLCGVCGLTQFSFQLAVGSSLIFPFDHLLPPSLFIPGFNLKIPVIQGMPLLKSNGLWFLEPSHFAQFLAFAIVIELSYFRRVYVLALLAASYMVSFSGSGIPLVFGAAVLLISKQGRLLPIALLAIGVLVIVLLRDVAPFSIFFGRIDEFSHTQSSGSMRFFAPYWFVQDVIAVRPSTLLFGFGPGRMASLENALDYATADTGWLKLLAEYGLCGAVPFLAFYCYSLFRRSPDPILSIACLFQFLFLGGYLNAFYVQFLHMALIAWPRVRMRVLEPNVWVDRRGERSMPDVA